VILKKSTQKLIALIVISQRLRAAGEKDANLSALTNLDCNATLVSFTIEDTLNELKQYYSAYKR
jgi:hypothetical protein